MKHTRELWIAEKTLQGRDSSISNGRGKTIAIVYPMEWHEGVGGRMTELMKRYEAETGRSTRRS